jgi:hypothetical protein
MQAYKREVLEELMRLTFPIFLGCEGGNKYNVEIQDFCVPRCEATYSAMKVP